MAGVNPNAELFAGEEGWKASMEFQNNVGDDGPLPTSGQNAVIPCTAGFTIFYNGSICVYDGIPAEKVHEIMSIAGAAAKSVKVNSGSLFTSLIPTPTSPSSPQGTPSNLASPQSVCFPAEKSSICRLQEFPIARRQSLLRFLEKRRNRLGSKAPYASPTTKAADNIENNFCANNTPDFSQVLVPLVGN